MLIHNFSWIAWTCLTHILMSLMMILWHFFLLNNIFRDTSWAIISNVLLVAVFMMFMFFNKFHTSWCFMVLVFLVMFLQWFRHSDNFYTRWTITMAMMTVVLVVTASFAAHRTAMSIIISKSIWTCAIYFGSLRSSMWTHMSILSLWNTTNYITLFINDISKPRVDWWHLTN